MQLIKSCNFQPNCIHCKVLLLLAETGNPQKPPYILKPTLMDDDDVAVVNDEDHGSNAR